MLSFGHLIHGIGFISTVGDSLITAAQLKILMMKYGNLNQLTLKATRSC